MNILKQSAVLIGVIVFGQVAEYVKLFSFYILSLISELLTNPIFWGPTDGPWLIDIVWNTILAASAAECLFTITIIYLNYLFFKKLVKWEINFTISFVLLLILFTFKYINTAILMINIEYFTSESLYENILFLGSSILGFIFSLIGTIYPIYYSYKRFDKKGNWTTEQR